MNHLSHTISDKKDWFNTLSDLDKGIIVTPFDEHGNYRNREKAEVNSMQHRICPVRIVGNFAKLFKKAIDINTTYLPSKFDDDFSSPPQSNFAAFLKDRIPNYDKYTPS